MRRQIAKSWAFVNASSARMLGLFIGLFGIFFFPIVKGIGGYWDWSFPYFNSQLGNYFWTQSSSWTYRDGGSPLTYSTDYEVGEIQTRIPIVLEWIGEGATVLDAGCYDGFYGSMFSKDGKNTVYGIDASADGISKASARGIHATVGDLEGSFPYEEGFFDVVHAGEVIEHLYDTDAFISECHRVLKPKGSLIISTPNVVSLPRRILYLAGKGKFFEASNSFSLEPRYVGHIRFFDRELLKKYIESMGFKMTDLTSDYVNFPFYQSKLLAKIKPTFGRSLIARFVKNS